jgi:hypothetical protein
MIFPRTETNSESLPRFNMPFEAGLFFGARKFGNTQQKTKIALVLEREKFLYQHFISDLNGIDTKAHNNEPEKAINCPGLATVLFRQESD